jgi:hypothetical protein
LRAFASGNFLLLTSGIGSSLPTSHPVNFPAPWRKQQYVGRLRPKDSLPQHAQWGFHTFHRHEFYLPALRTLERSCATGLPQLDLSKASAVECILSSGQKPFAHRRLDIKLAFMPLRPRAWQRRGGRREEKRREEHRRDAYTIASASCLPMVVGSRGVLPSRNVQTPG